MRQTGPDQAVHWHIRLYNGEFTLVVNGEYVRQRAGVYYPTPLERRSSGAVGGSMVYPVSFVPVVEVADSGGYGSHLGAVSVGAEGGVGHALLLVLSVLLVLLVLLVFRAYTCRCADVDGVRLNRLASMLLHLYKV